MDLTPDSIRVLGSIIGTLLLREAVAHVWRRNQTAADATPLMQYQLASAVQRLDGIATRFEGVVERVTRLEGLHERVERLEARMDERERRTG